MNILDSLGNGFAVALDPMNLVYVFIGVLLGTVIGVLPGLGPTATIALLLPMTYYVPPATSIIMLAGIYYGSMYGGTITSVLLRIPGEAASVVTTFDGYQMARRGRAGPALGISAIGSFIGGTVAVVGLTFFAPLLADLALKVGPPEYALLALLGILLVSYLGTTSFPRSLVMAGVGLLLAVVGMDPITGSSRFTFGNLELLNGLDLVALAMGLFGVSELIHTLVHSEKGQLVTRKIGRVLPTRKDLRDSRGPIARGTVVGFLIGCLPGGSGLMSSLASYAMEKKVAKDPSRFGKGAIEGVAGPESANNASSTATFVPLLTLGLPSNPVLALILAALLVQGITPGPSLVNDNPEIFWGVIASMYIGNVLLLLLNLPLVSIFVRLLKVKGSLLASVAVVITLVGAYTVSNRTFDMWIVVIAGVVGYVLRRFGFDPAPAVLAFVLGEMLEAQFRRSMLISDGSAGIFVQRPISAVLTAIILVVFVSGVVGALRRRTTARETLVQNVDARQDGADSDGTGDGSATTGQPADDAGSATTGQGSDGDDQRVDAPTHSSGRGNA